MNLMYLFPGHQCFSFGVSGKQILHEVLFLKAGFLGKIWLYNFPRTNQRQQHFDGQPVRILWAVPHPSTD